MKNTQTIEITVCKNELTSLKNDVSSYIEKCDPFLRERGFHDAIGKLTHFRLNNGNVEVHVEELGSTGCLAKPEDESFVSTMADEYTRIEVKIDALKKNAVKSLGSSLTKYLIQ